MAKRPIRQAIACSALLLGGGCNALAQDASDVETWRCNAPFGHYQVHELAIPGSHVVTGRILIHSVDKGEGWASQGKVSLEDSKFAADGCNCAGLAAKGFSDPAQVDFYAAHGDAEDVIDTRKFGVPITFRIELDPKGTMTVTIGKEHVASKTVPISHPHRDTIELSCSGADVSFLNIEAR